MLRRSMIFVERLDVIQPYCPAGAEYSAPSGAQGFVSVHIAYKYTAPLVRIVARYAFLHNAPPGAVSFKSLIRFCTKITHFGVQLIVMCAFLY